LESLGSFLSHDYSWTLATSAVWKLCQIKWSGPDCNLESTFGKFTPFGTSVSPLALVSFLAVKVNSKGIQNSKFQVAMWGFGWGKRIH